MQKLLIIDGLNLLFQMFFGMPSRIINKDGKAIQGTLGFTGALLKIIRITSPTHLVVLFDGEHENARMSINADYKANRIDYSAVPAEESPFSQIYDVYAALDCLGVMHTEIDEFEADDVIASYAHHYGNTMQIVISSFDSDFFQLINENVSVLRYRGDNTVVCDTAYIKSKYGIYPAQYSEYKSLTGDTADNIKGANKVGPKTAAQLINQFGSLQQIIFKADKIAKKSIRESIIAASGRLEQNYQLINLDDKAPMQFTIAELCYKCSGITTNEVLKAIGLR